MGIDAHMRKEKNIVTKTDLCRALESWVEMANPVMIVTRDQTNS